MRVVRRACDRLLDATQAVTAEWPINRVLIAREMAEISLGRVQELQSLLAEVPCERVSHVQLKRLAQTARATVRTGDTTPYANIVVSG